MASKFSNAALIRCLYRSLLKITKPLNSANNKRAFIFNCLLHRTGIKDDTWASFLTKLRFDDKDHFDTDIEEDEAVITKEGDDKNENQQHRQSIKLFRQLLQEIDDDTWASLLTKLPIGDIDHIATDIEEDESVITKEGDDKNDNQ
jgi:hypothetical protein